MSDRLTTNNNGINLVKLAIPIFIEQFMAVLTGCIDQVMISTYDEPLLTAVGTANTVLNQFILGFSILSLATTILISQYRGSQKSSMLGTIYSLAVIVNTIFGIITSVILIAFALPIAKLMNIDPSLYVEFCSYIRIVGGFLFFTALFTTFTAILKCNAIIKPIMFISVAMNIVNIILNFIFIYGCGSIPALGMTGAAIATVTSRGVGVILIIYFYIKNIGIKISLKELFPFPKQLFGYMLKLGLPSGGETLSWNLSQVVILMMINSFGYAQSSGRFYAGVFIMFSCIFSNAITQASQIIVGYRIGAKDFDGAKKQTLRTLKIASVASFGVAFVVWLISKPIMTMLTDDPEIIKFCSIVLFIDVILEVGRAFNLTLVRALQATGDTVYPIIVGIIVAWSVSVVFSYVFGVALAFGIAGVWASMALDEITRGLIYLVRWKSEKWKNKDFQSQTTQIV